VYVEETKDGRQGVAELEGPLHEVRGVGRELYDEVLVVPAQLDGSAQVLVDLLDALLLHWEQVTRWELRHDGTDNFEGWACLYFEAGYAVDIYNDADPPRLDVQRGIRRYRWPFRGDVWLAYETAGEGPSWMEPWHRDPGTVYWQWEVEGTPFGGLARLLRNGVQAGSVGRNQDKFEGGWSVIADKDAQAHSYVATDLEQALKAIGLHWPDVPSLAVIGAPEGL
jgi:hypothetical protein